MRGAGWGACIRMEKFISKHIVQYSYLGAELHVGVYLVGAEDALAAG